MKTNEPPRVSLILILLIFAFLAMIAIPAFAGGPDVEQNTKVETDVVLTGGDNIAENSAVISGSRSYGIGMGSGAIADCMADMRFAIIGMPIRNKFCENIELANWAENGNHTPASIDIRCSTKPAKEIFGSKPECVAMFVSTESADDHTQDNLRISEQTQALIADIASLQARMTVYEARIKALEQQQHQEAEKAIKAAQRANAVATAIEEKEVEKREYAQQTIERLLAYESEE